MNLLWDVMGCCGLQWVPFHSVTHYGNLETGSSGIEEQGTARAVHTKVINLGSDTFGNPIFQTVLQN